MLHLPQPILTALSRITAAGHEAFVAGGCVRDALLGREPHDFDIASSARPEQLMEVFSGCRVIETGLKHGTVTVLIGGMPIEITTYRGEDGAFAQTLAEDLCRRDLTINAMAYHPEKGLQDPFLGQNDLQNALIRCTGDANERILEDPLRMLRAARFASVLGFAIDPSTQDAMDKHRALLGGVSAERLASEFVKLLCGKDARRVLTEQIRLIGVFIPEALPMEHFDQHNHHHIYDVLVHTAVAVENIPPEPVLRLAAFFHDIGKPPCFRMGEDGEGHFRHHAQKSTEIAEEVLARLKMDTFTRERVALLVKYHDMLIDPTPKAVKRLLGKIGVEAFDQLILVKRADNWAQPEKYRARQQYLDEVMAIRTRVLEESQCFSLKDLAISGRDLMALGMKPGPEIGRTLEMLLEKVISDEVENNAEALKEYVQKL